VCRSRESCLSRKTLPGGSETFNAAAQQDGKIAMISGHCRLAIRELLLGSGGRPGENPILGDFARSLSVSHSSSRAAWLAAVAFSAVIGLAQAARAQQNYADQLTPTPDIEKVGQRYILMVLDQPDRDLSRGRTKVNVMIDTRTDKTWILQYTRKPDSNEQGYVWSEIPFAKAPGE
jgi:hypothetical protein